ncbi:MAG: GAF domain-containing sensor histidine kinase [Acidobacteriota bacterium]
MNFHRLRWAAILAPLAFLALLETARALLGASFATVEGRWLMRGAVGVGAVIFYGVVFTVLGRLQDRLTRQNQELEALRRAGLEVTSEISLDSLLERIVEQAAQLIGTHYGALSVLETDGSIRSFVTFGISPEEARQIEHPPQGKGLLGIVLRGGQRLRINNLRADDRSFGFPAYHPRMHSLLAVPVVCRGPYRGNLYLCDKLDDSFFDEDDEETLDRFAIQAAIAVDNAYFHSLAAASAISEERQRLARELHDGQAQVLAFVNTKAQAVSTFLAVGKTDDARRHLDQLAAAAREVLADVREGILGLRHGETGRSFHHALTDFVDAWMSTTSLVVEAHIEEIPEYSPNVELQVLRILQEALANVRKHAHAERVTLHLEKHGSGFRCRVNDDGRGFDPAAASPPHRRPRFGLATMRERAQAIGADLTIDSRPGEGTRVTLVYHEEPTNPEMDPRLRIAGSPRGETP